MGGAVSNPNSTGNAEENQHSPRTISIREEKNLAKRGPSKPALEKQGFQQDTEFTIRIVADLDRNAVQEDGSVQSVFKEGKLKQNIETGRYSIVWGKEDILTSNITGRDRRGMELSELKRVGMQLLTVCDKTGTIYEINAVESDPSLQPIMSVIGGNGAGEEPMKMEWMTVKDEELYIGSNATDCFDGQDGTYLHSWHKWIVRIDKNKDVAREDWTKKYKLIQKAAGVPDSGYIVHEAFEWSVCMQSWVILPRHVSHQSLEEALIEGTYDKKGTNMMLIADENFENIEAISIYGNAIPTHGFSSFSFVPGTYDQVIVAIKTMETQDPPTLQKSFATVFNVNGNVLMDETEIPGGKKYEGIEFIL
eukprot:CAMPEP_0117859006 /NCGR_PEP_ID=MMETSP0950-20121206/2862_1 /TAXON_ID=44440 /ORGANISM="Chattonella subsalsa, Strain CCMP2191" /LENGTH=363 /DNA_ID=CAMNT_0005708769 /DNA_START=102 /DNA_END=1194 /DNA_ORIENTATION=+